MLTVSILVFALNLSDRGYVRLTSGSLPSITNMLHRQSLVVRCDDQPQSIVPNREITVRPATDNRIGPSGAAP